MGECRTLLGPAPSVPAAAALQASAPLASQDIAGPPVLPAQFLREAVATFLDRLKQHQAAVAELEQVLLASGATGGLGGLECRVPPRRSPECRQGRGAASAARMQAQRRRCAPA